MAEEEDIELTREELMKDKYYGLIRPDNARVNDKLRKEQEEEKKKKDEAEKKKRKMEEMANKKNAKLAREEAERLRKKQEAEREQSTFEEFERSIKEGEGNLNEIFSTILRNTSAYELAFPNYNMEDGWDFNLLMTILEKNTSLLTLSLSRKNLHDIEGIRIAGMIKKNKKLRRLELEGNFLGPKTGSAFGEALKVNNTLRYLDLENNNLTKIEGNDKELDTKGIEDLLQGLKSNTMLISLNLANNRLNAEVGNKIIDCLRTNKTIINLEFFQNKDFKDRPNEKRADDESKYESVGLSIEQIGTIKEHLKNNNEAYVKMRTDEWKERKRMTSNYQDNIDTQIIIEARKTLEETRKKEREDIEMLYLNNFNENVKRMEDDFNNRVNQYFAELKEKKEKKKKKKKKKKK